MRRSKPARQVLGIQLFPFLAVLICTMGALIVLLVLVVQQARVSATQIVREQDGQDGQATLRKQLEMARDDETWRQQVLAQQRVEMARQLEDQRLELGHLEQHVRELLEERRQVLAQWEALQQSDGQRATDESALKAELARLQAELQAAQRARDAAQQKIAGQPKSYAIVPYEGGQGTFRRPIYLECTADGVIIHPEQIMVSVEDLQGPAGPGNPLASALRAIREHGKSQGLDTQGEPYPLLIVRPDGALSYAMARTAMKSWEDAFGYELVDADMRLHFPPRDPQLAQILDKTLSDARQRQAALAAAMPSRFADSGEVGFVVAPRGGLTPVATRSPTRFSPRGGSSRNTSTGSHTEITEQTSLPAAESDARPGSKPAGVQAGGNVPGGSSQGTPGGAQGGAACGMAPGALAQSRGKDWALVNSRGTGIRRPIRVACLVDRLLILPEQQSGQAPVAVLLADQPEQEIDQFVARIREQINAWGIAVPGGYWKPVLVVEVAADAEDRYQLLSNALLDSGFEVTRKPS